MSIALRRIRDQVRGNLRDTDDRKASFDPIEIDQQLCDDYLAVQARLPAHSVYTASAFTISAGLDTFSLPATISQWTANDGGAEYAGNVRIQIVSRGTWLTKVQREQIEALKTSATIATGIPDLFSLYEDGTQGVQGLCYPGAQVAEACNLYRTLMADDLRDFIGTGSDDMDDVEVQMSRLASRVLVLMSSANLLGKMGPKAIAERDINPNIAVSWRKDAEVLLYKEAERQHNLKDSGRFQRVTY